MKNIKQELETLRSSSTDLAATNARLDGLINKLKDEEAVEREKEEQKKAADAEAKETKPAGGLFSGATTAKPAATPTTPVAPVKP